MHVNPRLPNILQDMLAAARGVVLAHRPHFPSKVYPYSSERQDSRQRRAYAKGRSPINTSPLRAQRV
jgi:hypothetical protein